MGISTCRPGSDALRHLLTGLSNSALSRVIFPFALALALQAASATHAAEQQLPRLEVVAENVYALVGNASAAAPENLGRVANAGFVVGPTGVIVIDTGISYRHGRQLLKAIRHVTDRPIELVVITHGVREFVFGSAAFEETGARLLAHLETSALMQARCAHCLTLLEELLGAEMQGTRLIIPQETVSGTTTVSAGGEQIELLHFGWAATPGDLAIYHKRTRTLFAGGLVSANHVPLIRDADFEGWQRALDTLAELAPDRVVPGFGPPSRTDAIVATANYLRALDDQTRRLYAESASLLEALDNADLPNYANWHAYDPNHRRNALHRRLQLEIEDLGGDPRSTALPNGPP